MANKRTRIPRTSAKSARSGVSRRTLLIGAPVVAGGGALAWSLLGSTESASAGTITVWKSPTCKCCTAWVSYMRGKGYRVDVAGVADTVRTKIALGIPEALHSCHTSKIGDYIIEGHVPAGAIDKLLAERPALKGIALPGMPNGSPGMVGYSGIYDVVGFTADGNTRRFAEVGV
jgi:hypothetical protein